MLLVDNVYYLYYNMYIVQYIVRHMPWNFIARSAIIPPLACRSSNVRITNQWQMLQLIDAQQTSNLTILCKFCVLYSGVRVTVVVLRSKQCRRHVNILIVWVISGERDYARTLA